MRWMTPLILCAAVGCHAGEPRFGSLVADARNVKLKTDIRLFALTNGITIAMVPDRRTNLVSVDVRYLVGSADDPAGRSGMAHLVEHLAFQTASGTQGATLFSKLTGLTLGFNAYVSKDVTHYTSTAVADRIDALLELEAQRMEAKCGALDDATFARERDAVVAEEAERRSRLRDTVVAIDAKVWGADHPYARAAGSGEVAAATKDEACAFFDAYYAADRAVMVVTGNFEPEALQVRIGKRFGPISKKATAKPVDLTAPRLDGTRSEHVADVDHALALIYLPAPSWGAPDEAIHDLLLGGLNVELRDLDLTSDWVLGAHAGYAGAGRRRMLVIGVEVAGAKDLGRAVDEVMARGRDLFVDDDRDGQHDDDDDADDGRARRHLSAIRGALQSSTIGRYDRIEGRGAWLADYLTYAGHNDFMLATVRAVEDVTAEALVETAKLLFDERKAHVALIAPSGTVVGDARDLIATADPVDDLAPWRTTIDPAEAARALPLPKGARALSIDDLRFANGLRVLLYPDVSSPVVDARLIYPVGRADDAPAARGAAVLGATLLANDYERGYSNDSASVIKWATALATLLSADAGQRSTVFRTRGLAAFADWHVWRLSWLLDQGVYTDRDLGAANRARAAAAGEDRSAVTLERRRRLYGADHPFAAAPPSADELARIDAAQLAAWQKDHYATHGATLIITGGFKRETMRKIAAELFGAWRESTPVAARPVPPATPSAGPSWIRTSGDQTRVTLRVGFAAQSNAGRDRAAREVLAELIADRLRVAGASQDVRVGYDGVELAIDTALDPARAPQAAAAVAAELASLRGGAAALPGDFARARRRVFGRMLASRADAGSIADDLAWMVDNQLALAHLNNLAAAVGKLTPAQIAAVATSDLDPARMVVVVGGPTAAVDATLSALGATDAATLE